MIEKRFHEKMSSGDDIESNYYFWIKRKGLFENVIEIHWTSYN
jgi:hypothetical protein